jgi:hypothetical protein
MFWPYFLNRHTPTVKEFFAELAPSIRQLTERVRGALSGFPRRITV